MIGTQPSRQPGSSFFLVVAFLALSLPLAGAALADEDAPAVYGKGVQKGKVLRIGELMKDRDAYVGQPVRVEGTITDVCPHMGCWIELADEEYAIRFKVEDGVMVFPTEIKGQHATAEGTLRRIEMHGDEAVAWARHQAAERGEEFDPSSVKDPLVVYQLDGIGAVVSPRAGGKPTR